MATSICATLEDERRLAFDLLLKAKQHHRRGSLEISSIDDFTCRFSLDGLVVTINRCEFNTQHTIRVETRINRMVVVVRSPDFPWFAKLWNLACYFSDRRPKFASEKRNARYKEISSHLARV